MTPPPAEDRIGITLADRYAIESMLGRGGMGVVYAGRDARTGQEVAVKVLSRLSSQALLDARRFLLEAETLSGVRHRNIVRVIDLGIASDGVPFLVMERLVGNTLDDCLKKQQLDPQACLTLLVPIVGALARVHEAGFIHRDLKPANIFVVGQGAEKHAKLLDFGIVRRLERDGALTSSGIAVGTPGYMAPEQLAAAEVTFATDVYGLGVTMLHCLSGKRPLHALMLEELAHEAEQRGTPKALLTALRRAVHQEPSKRYADMRTFAEALATSAYLGDIALSDHPDPDGLPEWNTWIQQAALRTVSLRMPAPKMQKIAAEFAPHSPPVRPRAPSEPPVSRGPRPLRSEPVSPVPGPVVASKKAAEDPDTTQDQLRWVLLGVVLALLAAAMFFWLR